MIECMKILLKLNEFVVFSRAIGGAKLRLGQKHFIAGAVSARAMKQSCRKLALE